MLSANRLLAVGFATLFTGILLASGYGQAKNPESHEPPKSYVRVRFACFNVALNREKQGQLAAELKRKDSTQAQKIAEIIQRVRPDILLLNEVDHDDGASALTELCRNYLAVAQNEQAPCEFPHQFVSDVNTGTDSGLDLNKDGKRQTPDDAFGFGLFPGQYGMALLSRYPLGEPKRTFQKFLWRDMPQAQWPTEPESKAEFYSPEAKSIFRLSSKSHWDVPIQIDSHTIHVIAAHPTPPVFDGREDRNGCRNHDEIRLIADYLKGDSYIYDDAGSRGGLPAGASFVVMGDLNSDPSDGDSEIPAIQQLLNHPLVNASIVPTSEGGRAASQKAGQINATHQGDPSADTGDFNDRSIGNLRMDYVLPSKDLRIVGSGVFWPTEGDALASLAGASDHHLVWIDIELDTPQ